MLALPDGLQCIRISCPICMDDFMLLNNAIQITLLLF